MDCLTEMTETDWGHQDVYESNDSSVMADLSAQLQLVWPTSSGQLFLIWTNHTFCNPPTWTGHLGLKWSELDKLLPSFKQISHRFMSDVHWTKGNLLFTEGWNRSKTAPSHYLYPRFPSGEIGWLIFSILLPPDIIFQRGSEQNTTAAPLAFSLFMALNFSSYSLLCFPLLLYFVSSFFIFSWGVCFRTLRHVWRRWNIFNISSPCMIVILYILIVADAESSRTVAPVSDSSTN